MKKENFEEDVDIRASLKVVSRYKYSILLITLLVTALAFAYAYYQPNIYRSKASIQIGIGSKSTTAQEDLLQQVLNGVGGDTDVDTEISILESRFLILDAMKNIDMVTHIYGVNKFYKKKEFFLNAPITVDIEKGKRLKFKLIPIDNKRYKLEVKGKSRIDGVKFEYKREYRFGQTAKTKDYKLIVNKIGKLSDKYYQFIIYDKDYYANKIIDRINVKQHKKKAKVLDVTYTDNVPLRAKEFVNSLARAYIKQNIELKTKDATKTLSFINTQLNFIQKNLKESENKIEKFKTKEKTVDVKLSSENISKKLSDYESKIGILDMQISVFQKAFNAIKNGGNLDTFTLVGIGIDTQGIASLVQQLQQAILKKQELLKEFTPNHPEVQKLTTSIINLKRIIKKSISNMLSGLKQKKSLFKTQMTKYQKELKKLPKVQQDYLSLERKFTFNQKFYTYLLEKKTETEIKKAATVSQDRVVDSSLLPEEPIKPKRKLIVAAGLILGLILGLFIAFIRNFFNNTVKNSEDIERNTNTPIIAMIPKFYSQKNEKRKLIVRQKPKSATAESFRSLRTNLKFMIEKEEDEAKVISITSTVAAEGKTTIASNLALVLQMYGKKVVIINFDLRKPTLHTVFDMPNNKGLSAYLSHQTTIDEILKSSKFENLDIISSGTVPPNPSELIGSQRVQDLFNELKHRYDYIILDTPPIGLVSDAGILLSHSDIVLYVFKADYSKKEFVKVMNKFKKEKKIKQMGIVINGVKHQESYYGYGGYGGYYEK